MASLKALRKHGITEEKLKTLFTSDTPSPAVKRLKDRIHSRNQDGINNNFCTYKVYQAIDEAYNVPFRQSTVTLIQALAREPFDPTGPVATDIYSAARQLGIDTLLSDEVDPKTNKPTGKKIMSLPAFFKVFVPLVPAYVKIRAAKITNDRNQTPYFKFEPLISTPLNRARCELLTGRVEAMTTQMGLRDIGRQTILKSLIYSVCLQFIQEEWYEEEQENDEGKTVTTKEGLRYHLPHPTRTFWDIAHPLASLHSDTGCEYAGYWRVRRYRDVLERMNLWNVDKMRLPSTDYRNDHISFFNNVYPCAMSFPRASAKWNELGMDREDKLQNAFYTSDFEDSAVVLTEYFEKLRPSENGLGDYAQPVWFRFLVANSDTLLYAQPLPDCPVVYWGYDPDESREMNASLALEVLPSQDLVSNLLSQTILSVKQNLTNLTLVDEDILKDEKQIKQLENNGELWFRRINIFRYSGKLLQKLRNTQQPRAEDAVKTVRFPQLDTNGTITAIRLVLDLLERVLVMSAQEVAGQATHEQSAEESRNVKISTQTRLEYTASSYDRSYDAWKRQLYSYLMAYGEDDIYAFITPNPSFTDELFKEMDMEVIEQPAQHSDMKMLVKGKKKALLQLEYFASTRDGQDRTNHPALANAMTQFLASALSNQMLQQAIGPVQAIQLMNQALEQFGFPRDFKLQALPVASPDEQQQWVMQQLQALSQQMQQFVGQALTQSQQTVLQEVMKAMQPLQQATQQIAQALPQVQQAGQQALEKSARNELAIAKIAEVLEHHQELNNGDVDAQTNPINRLANPVNPPMAVPA